MSARNRQYWAAHTDIGRVRSHNEDSILAEPPLFVIADGLGGHEAGEVASQLAAETIRDHAPRRPDANALARAVRTANREVLRAAREGVGRTGMGTTITTALVDGVHAVVAQVGDSRAYLLHDGTLSRITQDHSMVADLIRSGQISESDARVHPNRSVITRALGTDPNMFADTYEIEGSPGDRLLLCSDGLTAMLTDDRIAQLLGGFRDPGSAVHALIDAANEAGGQDNISVIVVDLQGEPSASGTRQGERRIRGWISVLAWLFVAIALTAGIAFATYSYAHSRAYVLLEGDELVIYQGVQGQLAGLSVSERVSSRSIAIELLPPTTQAELRDGKAFSGVAEAYTWVDDLDLDPSP
jgi:protein phosphatase